MSKIRWKDISIIFQGAMNALNPVQQVGKQIAEPIMLHEGLSENKAMVRARELFDLVGINPKRVTEFPHEMSGGMRQRAMIAMALACNPKLVIGDEPTTALRRHGAGPDPRPDRAPASRARPLLHPDQPRPLGHGRDLRQGRHHVRRQGGRGGHDDRHLHRTPRTPTPSSSSAPSPTSTRRARW